MGRIGRQMAAVTRASLKIGLFRVELQRQYPPCLIKQFVITMCERALSSERSQDHGRILQDCSSTCQSFRRGRCAASPGRPFRRKRQGVQRMLKIPCENKDPFCGSPQYPIHLELDVLCQDVVLRPPSKSQTSTKAPIALCLRLSSQSKYL